MVGATTRVLLVASGGGHWVQLSRLRAAFADADTQYVTTLAGSTAPSGSRPIVIVPDASRQEKVKLALLMARMAGVMLSFRPDVVVTTGAAPGLLALQLGKLMGARTVWLDSIANAEQLSLSGKLARRFADLWLTQWEHLVDGNLGLEFHGRVL